MEKLLLSSKGDYCQWLEGEKTNYSYIDNFKDVYEPDKYPALVVFGYHSNDWGSQIMYEYVYEGEI